MINELIQLWVILAIAYVLLIAVPLIVVEIVRGIRMVRFIYALGRGIAE